MKDVHRLVCPGCGMETLTECEYVTCPCCRTYFYAAQSAHVRPQAGTHLTTTMTFGAHPPASPAGDEKDGAK